MSTTIAISLLFASSSVHFSFSIYADSLPTNLSSDANQSAINLDPTKSFHDARLGYNDRCRVYSVYFLNFMALRYLQQPSRKLPRRFETEDVNG